MYQYHGWLSSLEDTNSQSIESKLKELNRPYPASCTYVNGELHISFSGSPNRDLGNIESILNYLCDLNLKLFGCVYINDPNSERHLHFDIIKIVEDRIIYMEDQNFTEEETKEIFE